MNSEKWLPIEGYVGLYEVSTAGRVRSLPRTIKRPIGSYLKGEMVRKPVAGTVGEKHPMAKLTDAQVRALRIRRAEGESVSVLAAEFNVSRMTAHRAAVCKSWSHIQ